MAHIKTFQTEAGYAKVWGPGLAWETPIILTLLKLRFGDVPC